jgi:uncharacterized membrane protein
MLLRLSSLLILVLSAICLPFYITVFFFILCLSFFNKFWEGVIAGIFLDAFYFSPLVFEKFHLGFFTVTFIVSVLFVGVVKHFIQGKNIIARSLTALIGLVGVTVIFAIFYGNWYL